MGYTHYWYQNKELPKREFAVAVRDCAKVCAALPVPLGGFDGTGPPEFADDDICFNGSVHSENFSRDAGTIPWPTDKANAIGVAGQEAQAGTWFAGTLLATRAVDENGDGSYETFHVPRKYIPLKFQEPAQEYNGKYFSFCKTAFRPYDLCVQCCLIILKEHLRDKIIVRSDGTTEQWNEARDACQVFLGYGLLFQLDEAD